MFRALRSISGFAGMARNGVRVTLSSSSFNSMQMVNPSVFMNTNRGIATISLQNIRDREGAFKRHRILGRGRSSGLGKTSGRGQKGQNCRSGRRSRVRYEGGQTMLWRRSPKRGFKNVNRKELATLNIGKLIDYICMGRIDPLKPITLKAIHDSNIIGRFKYGVKILADGVDKVARLPVPLHLEVSHTSSDVRDAVVAAGGSVNFIYYSKLGLRHHLKPGCLGHFVPGPSVPPPNKSLRYDLQLAGKDGVKKAAEVRLARIVRKFRVR